MPLASSSQNPAPSARQSAFLISLKRAKEPPRANESITGVCVQAGYTPLFSRLATFIPPKSYSSTDSTKYHFNWPQLPFAGGRRHNPSQGAIVDNLIPPSSETPVFASQPGTAPPPKRNIVFFNEHGLRAGWRLLIYILLVASSARRSTCRLGVFTRLRTPGTHSPRLREMLLQRGALLRACLWLRSHHVQNRTPLSRRLRSSCCRSLRQKLLAGHAAGSWSKFPC